MEALLHVAHHAVLGLICAACGVWVLWWLISYEPPVTLAPPFDAGPYRSTAFFGIDASYGSALFYQSGPFVIVALLSYAMIEIRKKLKWLEYNKKEDNSKVIASTNLTTYPLVVRRSPLGVLTIADVLFILAIVFLVTYTFARQYYLSIKELDHKRKADPSHYESPLALFKLAHIAFYMGRSGMIPFALLWIPVSRGSPFLRLINMPFEHAVRYHIWLAKLAITMLTLHGVFKGIDYIGVHEPHEIIKWDVEGENCSVLAGVVAMIAALVMWATSIASFRKKWFEMFFGIHHLYMLVYLCFLYHVPWTIHLFTIPGLLFGVDRFLRMVQSQRSVDVLSAKLLECGSIEIKVAKGNNQGIKHHALSSWCIRFPNLSRWLKLQWHFFSATSTQNDEKEELSLVIKPLGKWTSGLREKIFTNPKFLASSSCPFAFKAGVEGPYGDESDFFLEYKILILVSGGIGITPMLALLRDVLHRYRRGETNLPTCIYFYHCVRDLDELCVLNSVDPNEILPDYNRYGLQIHVFAYVTSAWKDEYNKIMDIKNHRQALDLATFEGFRGGEYQREVVFSKRGKARPKSISSISTKGKTVWVASTVLASIVGFYVLWGLSNAFIVGDHDANFTNYNRVNLAITSMVLGVVLFGGLVVTIWRQRLKWVHQKSSKKVDYSTSFDLEEEEEEEEGYACTQHKETVPLKRGSPWEGVLRLSCRPFWREIFIGINKAHEGKDIGVLVSGSLGLQEDVAEECRLNTKLFGRDACSNTFHFHPTSFEL